MIMIISSIWLHENVNTYILASAASSALIIRVWISGKPRPERLHGGTTPTLWPEANAQVHVWY